MTQANLKRFFVWLGHDETYLLYDADQQARGWFITSHEGREWSDGPNMQHQHIYDLVRRFGLLSVFDEKPMPPFEKLRYLSPSALIRMRRAWEKKNNLPPLEVVSGGPGERVKAELVIGLTPQHVAA